MDNSYPVVFTPGPRSYPSVQFWANLVRYVLHRNPVHEETVPFNKLCCGIFRGYNMAVSYRHLYQALGRHQPSTSSPARLGLMSTLALDIGANMKIAVL